MANIYKKKDGGGWLFDIQNRIEDVLLGRNRIKFRGNTLEIIRKNFLKSNREIDKYGFFYRGELFHNMAPNVRTHGMLFGSLLEEFIPEMDFLLNDRKNENFDMQRIRNVISLIVKNAKDLQDIRDSLPECLVDLIPELNRYPRTREEAFLIKDNYSLERQWKPIKEKIEFLCAMRFFE